MKTYIVMLVMLSVSIPLAIKFGVENVELKTANTGPCMLNNSVFDDSPFSGSSLDDKYLPNNIDTYKKTDAFQSELSNNPHEGMVDFEPEQDQPQAGRLGQKCEFGVCLPSQEERGMPRVSN